MIGNIFNYIIRTFILCSVSVLLEGRLRYPASAKNSLCVLGWGQGVEGPGDLICNFLPRGGAFDIINLSNPYLSPTSPLHGGEGGSGFAMIGAL